MPIYDKHAPLLVERGYFPLPISPAGFEPAKVPVRNVPSLGGYHLLAGWNTRSVPITTPQPGANIGVRCGNGLVAFDFDDEDAALAISEAFDPSPVNKAGRRAWTPFYRADFDVPSEDFFDPEGRKVLQILSTGRQTVLPPSIHPDTNEPYRWTNGKSLYDTPLSELPLLPRDYRERILAISYVSGKVEKKEQRIGPETGEVQNGFDNNPFQEINALALRNLAAWVLDLGLYGCKRRKGRFASYEAVATWRQSTTGKALEERSPNLKISGSGIKDFGDGKGYSPLDLVMAAQSCSLSEAFSWLEERVLPKKAEVEVDWEKIVETPEAPLSPGGEEEAEGQDSGDAPPPDGRDDARTYGRIRLLRYDAIPPELLPRRPWIYRRHYLRKTVSMTVGDSGIGKTSLGLTEAVGLAIGRDLLGNEQIKPYKVWYHNGEDTRDEINLRLGAICRHYGLDQTEVQRNLFITCGLDMPVQVAAGGPPIIDKKLVQNVTDAISGEEIDVSIFDPLVTMHGVNENSTEIRSVLREVFARIGNFTGCAVEIAHHTRKLFPGQTESTGSDVRGSTEIKAAVRGMRTVNVMSKTEAELYEIGEEDRLSYFKTVRDKANMARRGQVYWQQWHASRSEPWADVVRAREIGSRLVLPKAYGA
jgi:AAA domain-containing protein/bifunctional DNA primase/polymerase-like protein